MCVVTLPEWDLNLRHHTTESNIKVFFHWLTASNGYSGEDQPLTGLQDKDMKKKKKKEEKENEEAEEDKAKVIENKQIELHCSVFFVVEDYSYC